MDFNKMIDLPVVNISKGSRIGVVDDIFDRSGNPKGNIYPGCDQQIVRNQKAASHRSGSENFEIRRFHLERSRTYEF